MSFTEENQVKLFEIKSRFFREILHPKLIVKAIRDLGFKSDLGQIVNKSIDYSEFSLEKAMEHYVTTTLAIKLNISKAQDAESLADILCNLLGQQINFLNKLANYSVENYNYKSSELKESDAFDAYQIGKYITLKGLQESEIKPYICAQVNLVPLGDLDVLSQSSLRAKKIIENGRTFQ